MRVVKIFIIIFFVLDIYLLYKVTLGKRGIKDYITLKKVKADLAKNIEDLQRENIALSKEIDLIKRNREFQKKIIRKRLYFGEKGEILYIISKR